MSFLPGLNDASLLDLSLVDDSEDFDGDDGAGRIFPATASGSASGSGSGSGSGSLFASASGSGSGLAASASGLAPSAASISGSSGSAPFAARSRPRFSLFAPAAGTPAVRGAYGKHDKHEEHEEHKHDEHEHDEHEHDEEEEGNRTARESGQHDEHEQHSVQPAAPTESRDARDARLRATLAELRQFNAVFEGFHAALVDTRAHNERVAARVAETHALLDKYVAFQGQALHTQALILNPRWTGGTEDEAALHAAEQARLEAEYREAQRLEAERIAAEERARAAEAQAQAQAQAAATATRGRGRGRGASHIARPATGIPTRTARPGSRPTSAAGRWGHVQSSGYGPRRSQE